MAQSEGSIFDPHKLCGASAQEVKENGVRAQGHGGGGRQVLITSSRLNSIDVISNRSGGTLPVDPS